jgi:plastocyanin
MPSLRSAAIRLVALALGAALVAACASSTPGWTYAPAPSKTPAASAAPSGSGAAPSASASAAPSESASAAPSDGGGGTVIQVAAQNIAFDQANLSAPANQPFKIEFANNDAGTPHNVAIKDSSGAEPFMGEVFNGVETRTYDVPALAPGEYTFVCSVHPNMTGTLSAQ